MKLNSLSECINSKIELLCNSAIKDTDLHCHVVSKKDVFKAVRKLKSDKTDVEGRVLSNNYIHGTNYLFMYLPFMFFFMINHGYAPDTFMQANMITEFHACDSETLDSLHSTFCMHMYRCELWSLTSNYINKYIIAWRKIKRRIWKIPPTSHKYIVHNLSSDCKKLLENRIIKFIHNALNINNMCAQILKVKLRCKNSSFADNYRYLSYKYNLTNSDWINDIGSLYWGILYTSICANKDDY